MTARGGTTGSGARRNIILRQEAVAGQQGKQDVPGDHRDRNVVVAQGDSKLLLEPGEIEKLRRRTIPTVTRKIEVETAIGSSSGSSITSTGIEHMGMESSDSPVHMKAEGKDTSHEPAQIRTAIPSFQDV